MALPRTSSESMRTAPVSARGRRSRAARAVLRAELARVRKKERRNLAERLHDGIGQDLILAKMKVDRLKSILPADHAGLAGEISDLIGRNIGDARALIRELSSDWLSDVDFPAALKSLAGYIQTKYSLGCGIEMAARPAVRRELRTTLLQAIRELLVNAAKHAQASETRVFVAADAGCLRIEVADNGRGFPKKSSGQPGGFGLFSVRARLSRIGAALRIDSRSGTGTRAIITLPQPYGSA